jgi:hypothetical protein
MESLEAVELAMALEECCGAGGFEIDPETTLGDLHWRMIQQECQRRPPPMRSGPIWRDSLKNKGFRRPKSSSKRGSSTLYCEMIS